MEGGIEYVKLPMQLEWLPLSNAVTYSAVTSNNKLNTKPVVYFYFHFCSTIVNIIL